MKKLLLIIFSLACIAITKANPLPSPPPIIGLSEIGFDSDGKWAIELGYQNIYNENTYMPVDSIFICSSTGRAKLKNMRFNSWAGIMMVRNDSLLSNLIINPAGDSIQIEYYYRQYSSTTKGLYIPLVFGNFKNATLACPKTGQSIASYFFFNNIYMYNSSSINPNVYSIDISPTLGVENDTTGMCGTLKGQIYDQNNQLLTNSSQTLGTYGIYDNIQPLSDGSYSVKAFSFKNTISKMYYSEGYNNFIVDILPIEYNMMPDSVISVDIHILKITAVDEIKSDPVTILQISPNPIKDLLFNYEISIPVKSSASFIELISLSGQKIVQFPITENVGKINLPANTTNGIYTLRLLVNNKNYGTSKIIIDGK
jgi:hypothetical protein